MPDFPKAEKNLLIIDDNPQTKNLLTDFFSPKYLCGEAASVEAFLSSNHLRQYGVIICNYNFLKSDMAETIARLIMRSPESLLIPFGEKVSADEVISVFRAGAFDYIQLPFNLPETDRMVQRLFQIYESNFRQINYQTLLEEVTAELDKAHEEIEKSYRLTLKALVQALETRDFETYGHSERAVTFSLRLGYELGLDKKPLRNLEFGALLHDIGKIGIPDSVLRKPAALNAEEWRKIKLHTIYGQRILRNIPFLADAERIVSQHHEKWDGTGYPLGLRGEEIDLNARIFSVVDAFDAMMSDRVYRRGRSYRAALEELSNCAGTQFDPAIVEAFKRVPKEDWEILRHRSLGERQETMSFQAIVAELVYSRQQLELIH